MPLKPEDKTAIIAQLRKSLSKCCPPMVVSKDTEDTLELIGNKPVPYGSKKKIVPGMYFASFVARKDSVSLYFFAIYFHAKDYVKTVSSKPSQDLVSKNIARKMDMRIFSTQNGSVDFVGFMLKRNRKEELI
jgi:hypothetical protein